MRNKAVGLLFSGILLLAACSEEPPAAPPPIQVVVAPVALKDYQGQVKFSGHLEAVEDIAIQAKVSGYLTDRPFKEGQEVKAGELLFAIEQASFKAKLEEAKAGMERSKANLTLSETNLNRAKELSKTGAISASEVDQLTGAFMEAKAQMAASEAALESAKVDLDYTRIKAPIDGVVGRSEVFVGDLVGPDSGALTTLVSTSAMQVVFAVNERLVLQSKVNRMSSGKEFIPVELEVLIEMSNGVLYPHQGNIDFVSNRINPNTGTFEVRATIPNPDNLLTPGQYVRVIVRDPEPSPTMMIPQATVQSDQKGDYVLVVKEGVVERRYFQSGSRVNSDVIVEDGLSENEQVILQGLQKVRPGQTVVAVPQGAKPQATDKAPQG